MMFQAEAGEILDKKMGVSYRYRCCYSWLSSHNLYTYQTVVLYTSIVEMCLSRDITIILYGIFW